MLDFNMDVDRLARQLNRSPQLVQVAAESALDRCAIIALQAKGRMIDRTYRRAIPKGKNGRPRWRRSGAFQRGQTIEKGRGVRRILTTGPAAKYERRLANLRTVRRNPAAEDAAKIIAPQVRQVFEQELRNALGL